ncbi:MAG: hypothetical protein VCA39_03380 [Pseudomonas sp.]|jgi:hypothetical protein|uniref:hypothetical protein n=2 Tax=Pseudomonas TaxID=286 RepID=UPI0039828302
MTECRVIPRRFGVAMSLTVLGLWLTFPAGAVQLPSDLLPADLPWILPSAKPLTGLEHWQLHGLFRQGNGGGWALLSIGQAAAQRVEFDAVLPGGIRLAAIENEGVWLQRGQARAFLRLGGTLHASVAGEVVAEVSAPPAAPPASCQDYLSGGVPLDELTALGVCPAGRTGL